MRSPPGTTATANPSAGDVQDQLLDALKTKLTTTQQTQVVSALASNTSPTAVKSLVGNSATANLNPKKPHKISISCGSSVSA